MYNKYADPNQPDKICQEGVIQLLEDLGLDPSSRTVLLFAWKLRASAQCEFSKQEFTQGLLEMGCDSIGQLRSKLPSLEEEIAANEIRFREFYQVCSLRELKEID